MTTFSAFTRRGWIFPLLILGLQTAHAVPNSHPAEDPRFLTLPGGLDLRTITVKGSRLSVTKGAGRAFTAANQASYEQLKRLSKTVPKYPLQWVLMDLDSHQVLDQSLTPDMKMFGASSSKIFVGGALLDFQDGVLTKAQAQTFGEMIAVSSNAAWTSLQKQLGGGDANKGRERVHAFTQRLGYLNTRGFQGYWGKIHGNELTAADSAEYLYDTYQANYPGAETLWKYMYTCRTGDAKGDKYIPSDVYVGGKTGTYSGPSEDPETGRDVTVKARNHILTFNIDGRQYGLAVLGNNGSDESVALMAGGLLREYTRYR